MHLCRLILLICVHRRLPRQFSLMILRTVADLPCHVDYPLIMDDGSINSRFRASDDLRKLIIQGGRSCPSGSVNASPSDR